MLDAPAVDELANVHEAVLLKALKAHKDAKRLERRHARGLHGVALRHLRPLVVAARVGRRSGVEAARSTPVGRSRRIISARRWPAVITARRAAAATKWASAVAAATRRRRSVVTPWWTAAVAATTRRWRSSVVSSRRAATAAPWWASAVRAWAARRRWPSVAVTLVATWRTAAAAAAAAAIRRVARAGARARVGA